MVNSNNGSALAWAVVVVVVLAGSQQAAALTPLDSSSFDNRYDGNEIWDGANFLNQWAQNGGGDDSLPVSQRYEPGAG